LLTDPDGINVLKVHWDFLNGLIRKVEGVLEVKAFVVGSPGHDALSPDELRQQLLSKFARDYAKLGYAGESVQFEKVAINGRTWLKCRTPITGLTEFSTGLSSNMYLTVHFSFIDNASEGSTEVYRKVDELYEKLVTSMVIAPSSQHR
jgi:hypothetical protein